MLVKSFDTFSEVSKSDDGDESKEPLIKNDNLIFDLDNMCFNSYLKENGGLKVIAHHLLMLCIL